MRRTRWLLTALFTAITAGCLVALGLVAASIDSHSRERALDNHVDRVVTGLARQVYRDDETGALDFDGLRTDDLAQGHTAVALLETDPDGHWRERFVHQRSALPDPMGLEAIADRVVATGVTAYATAIATTGAPVRLAAEPIDDGSKVIATVIAGTDPTPSRTDHRLLVEALVVGCGTLVAAAAAAGHLLSGRSMRPALAMLDEQERFLSDAAHELRTPLATLQLVTEPHARTTAEADLALQDAHRLTGQMARLVTGLLARTRTRTGVAHTATTPLRLDQLAESIVEEVRDGHDITLTTSETIVTGDPDLLGLAIRNLLDNAITHGAPEHRRAQIDVTVADGRVAVRDHGPGIDPAIRGNPFDRGVTGPDGHHGIGLAIVAWVAQLHSGTATIEPAPGGGVVATIALPQAHESRSM
ncbi:hypothetical protein MAUB_47220 [Mycolicibacterium aubagnense]|uniref:histidine kinase n=1 Tax=Mycolicibacterium aubagnense TaxID=319707 RepID=A0ABN5Z170_9MYCO|nr:two-component sensor histidine kinase [Mycolicibacterium aubagnense]BBX86849.1 hypothetical protein MAUB_47220 [Mycolicibacterium aubagnense]